MPPAQMLDQLTEAIASHQRAAFRSHYRAIVRLPRSRGDLQGFLEDYLMHVVQLYAATAGAIWFRTPQPGVVTAKVAQGLGQLPLTEDTSAAHDQLVQFALSQDRSFLVRPYSAAERSAAASNPTDSFVLFGPVDHQGERIAVVELFLGPHPTRGRTAAERNRYVLWLDHLIGFLCQGIEQRLLRKSAPLPPALEQLGAATHEAAALQEQIRQNLERQLQAFEGWNFGSLTDNQAFTARVHALLEQFGLRARCPQCGSPAILRCQNAGNAKQGAFLFDHTLSSGRTFHGGSTSFPKLELLARPKRRTKA